MKKVLTSILKNPCRVQTIEDTDRDTFHQFNYLQRYHPGLETFTLPEGRGRRLASLPHSYKVRTWKEQSADDARIYNVTLEDASGVQTDGKAFVKVVHLLDPITLLREEYMIPDHPLLPLGEEAWKNTLTKLHSKYNQAYVDAVACYVIGQLRAEGHTPHAALSYGSFTAIAKNYKYKITDEYEGYRTCRWFWRGLKAHSASLEVERDSENILENPDYADIVQTAFTCPFKSLDDHSVVEEELDISGTPEVIEDTNSLHSFDFDVTEEEEEESPKEAAAEQTIRIERVASDEDEEESDSSSDESDEESDDSTEYDVTINLPSMPVIMICQEAQESTMDDLLDEEEIDGVKRDTPAWDRMWLAWLFQVIANLSFLQKHISFTHNDLHTNNIVWRKTEDTYLYYKAADGMTFRVPTHGRIFSIIDFGRAIFKIQDQLWISDDHLPNNDAGGQYNFAHFQSIESPKVVPNPSFDLCRLAISMLEGLYDDYPKKKAHGSLLSQEGTWKVYETVSPLFNLLWQWTLDDDGKTVFEDRDGEEKYPGFELYVVIAKTVHDAVPRDQVRKPVFESFHYKGKIAAKMPVYSLGC